MHVVIIIVLLAARNDQFERLSKPWALVRNLDDVMHEAAGQLLLNSEHTTVTLTKQIRRHRRQTGVDVLSVLQPCDYWHTNYLHAWLRLLLLSFPNTQLRSPVTQQLYPSQIALTMTLVKYRN